MANDEEKTMTDAERDLEAAICLLERCHAHSIAGALRYLKAYTDERLAALKVEMCDHPAEQVQTSYDLGTPVEECSKCDGYRMGETVHDEESDPMAGVRWKMRDA